MCERPDEIYCMRRGTRLHTSEGERASGQAYALVVFGFESLHCLKLRWLYSTELMQDLANFIGRRTITLTNYKDRQLPKL